MVGVIGSPVAHSLSPLLHNAAFAALGLVDTGARSPSRWRLVGCAAALDAMRRADVAGCRSPCRTRQRRGRPGRRAAPRWPARLDAVNCVVNRDGVLLGTNTDGEGFVASLARGAGFDPAGKRCLVVGAGGAARAVVLALAEAGASRGRGAESARPERARGRRGAGRPGRLGGGGRRPAGSPRRCGSPTGGQRHPGRDGRAAVPSARGRWTRGCSGPARWRPTWSTPPGRRPGWRAAASGRRRLDGLGMLVHQAAAQLALWTGWSPRSRPCGRRPRRPRRRPDLPATEPVAGSGGGAAAGRWVAGESAWASTGQSSGLGQRRERRPRAGPASTASRWEGIVSSVTRMVIGRRVRGWRPTSVGRLGAVRGERRVRRHRCAASAITRADRLEVRRGGPGQGEVDDGTGPATREVADEADVAVGDDVEVPSTPRKRVSRMVTSSTTPVTPPPRSSRRRCTGPPWS